MKVIGITGGIGSGKSTVSKHLIYKGYMVLDADKIAREITEKNSPVLDILAKQFGNEIISDGELNRKVLRQIVFSDVNKRKILDEITHREIKKLMEKRIEDYSNLESEIAYNNAHANLESGKKDKIFIDAPLLFEAKVDEMTDENWVVCTEENLRIKRTMERDNCLEEEVLKVINHQMSDDEKKNLADKVIENNGTIEELITKVEALLQKE